MAGIKLINTLPETFRFPEWRDDIFYAADSFVRYAQYMSNGVDSDSENLVTKFYIALKDIPAGTGIPPRRQDVWARIAENAQSLATVVAQIIENDSDILWLRGYADTIKSETDSDLFIIKTDHDSDTIMLYHDYRAEDSDLNYKFDSEINWIRDRIIALELEEDSDNKITRDDHDSDLLMTYHDFRADDSDFRVEYDSDLKDLRDFDSDVEHFITLPSWDYGSYTF